MKMLRAWMSLVLVCSTGLIVGAAVAQDGYPSKQIRLVVPYTPAGGTDLLARMVARRLGESLGVTIVIDNRPGADGTIGTNVVAKANPDGYTLLLDGTSQAYNVAFGKQMPYDPTRD
ncbi:MAG: Bug family tripartite tricarboxylate transporter substrate binding protein, partial [Advenella sp.]